jgi:AAA-like domain/TIR domain
MAHDVFVSYSNRNKAVADAVCATLEEHGVRCWIAPRNVPPGLNWSESIIDAIEGSHIMVLVFTADANASQQIHREVERAINRGLVILPLRIEDVPPSRALEYFIGNVQWLDAVTPPLEMHLRTLTESVKALLARPAPGARSLRGPASGSAGDPAGAPISSSALGDESRSPENASHAEVSGMQLGGPSTVDAPGDAPVSSRNQLPPAGGTVPVDSPYYVVRPVDKLLEEALDHGDSIVMVKGAGQMGKTSVLARGLLYARRGGKSVVLVDLQKLSQSAFSDVGSFYKAIGRAIAHRLGLELGPENTWWDELSPGDNFERFFRRVVLNKVDGGLVIAMDEVDRLQSYPFAQEVFGLFRSWHNERVIDPDGPWTRLTLVVACCTDFHLLITDENQSPFNVGTHIELRGFSVEQVEKLNELCRKPVSTSDEMRRFYEMFNGHPYLTQLAFREMIQRGISADELITTADADSGAFGDHLGRMLTLLNRDEKLLGEVRGMLDGRPIANLVSFYRLRSAGVVVGASAHDARLGCGLYQRCFARHFGSSGPGSLETPRIERGYSSLRDSADRPIRIQ